MDENTPAHIAARMEADIRALPARNTAAVRAVRRRYSRALRDAPAGTVFDVARQLTRRDNQRWLAYELIREHKAAFRAVDEARLLEFGRGMSGWDVVDSFGRTLSGPAWLAGQVSDEVIYSWAESEDLWWRRAALVSTVALNMRSHGGRGDTARTLAVCRMLAADREDMVVKALSWALRELAIHDTAAVTDFLTEYDAVLASRVKREVRNKMATGLKNPRVR